VIILLIASCSPGGRLAAIAQPAGLSQVSGGGADGAHPSPSPQHGDRDSTHYLSLLDTFYDEWLRSYDISPVLTIRTDDLDFVHQLQALEIVVERIREKLGGKEELDLRGTQT